MNISRPPFQTKCLRDANPEVAAQESIQPTQAQHSKATATAAPSSSCVLIHSVPNHVQPGSAKPMASGRRLTGSLRGRERLNKAIYGIEWESVETGQASPSRTRATRDYGPLQQALAKNTNIVLTQDVFSRLLPSPEQFKSADPHAVWRGFDDTLLDSVLAAFKSGRIEKIIDRKGVGIDKIEMSILCNALYRKSEDLDKSKVAEMCFKKVFDSPIGKSNGQVYQKQAAQFVEDHMDQISSNCSNARKIIRTQLHQAQLSPELADQLNCFMDEMEREMPAVLRNIKAEMSKRAFELGQPCTARDIAITTCSAGGAHKSIAKDLESQLKERGLNAAQINETDLYLNDSLSKTIGLAFGSIYNEIIQKRNNPKYGEKLRQLFIYLNDFIPDDRANILRYKVGDAQRVISTNHYGHNQRLASENSDPRKMTDVSWIICDFGRFTTRLDTSIKKMMDNDLDGYSFFVPDPSMILHLGQSPEQNLLLATGTGESENVFAKILQLLKHADEVSPGITTGAGISLKKEGSFQKGELLQELNRMIVQSAYPIDDSFSALPTREGIKNTKATFNIPTEAKLVTVAMGAQGLGGEIESCVTQFVNDAAKTMAYSPGHALPRVHILALCGQNELLMQSVANSYQRDLDGIPDEDIRRSVMNAVTVQSQGWVSAGKPMAELMKASDLFVTKPGGRTVAELERTQTPTLLKVIPSHFWEFGNVAFMQSQGLATTLGDKTPLLSLHDACRKKNRQIDAAENYAKVERLSLGLTHLYEKYGQYVSVRATGSPDAHDCLNKIKNSEFELAQLKAEQPMHREGIMLTNEVARKIVKERAQRVISEALLTRSTAENYV